MNTPPNSAQTPPFSGNSDAAEIAKFEAAAHRFWDVDGEFKPLHRLNPVRARYVQERTRLQGARVLDVGCGGGLLAESLARAGATVTAIDLAPTMVETARLHALGWIWTTPGFTDERIWLFLATGLVPGRQDLQEDEALSVERLPLARALALALAGGIDDGKSIAALARAAAHLGVAPASGPG